MPYVPRRRCERGGRPSRFFTVSKRSHVRDPTFTRSRNYFHCIKARIHFIVRCNYPHEPLNSGLIKTVATWRLERRMPLARFTIFMNFNGIYSFHLVQVWDGHTVLCLFVYLPVPQQMERVKVLLFPLLVTLFVIAQDWKLL